MGMKYITDVHKIYLIVPTFYFKRQNNWFPEVKGFWEQVEPNTKSLLIFNNPKVLNSAIAKKQEKVRYLTEYLTGA